MFIPTSFQIETRPPGHEAFPAFVAAVLVFGDFVFLAVALAAFFFALAAGLGALSSSCSSCGVTLRSVTVARAIMKSMTLSSKIGARRLANASGDFW